MVVSNTATFQIHSCSCSRNREYIIPFLISVSKSTQDQCYRSLSLTGSLTHLRVYQWGYGTECVEGQDNIIDPNLEQKISTTQNSVRENQDDLSIREYGYQMTNSKYLLLNH